MMVRRGRVDEGKLTRGVNRRRSIEIWPVTWYGKRWSNVLIKHVLRLGRKGDRGEKRCWGVTARTRACFIGTGMAKGSTAMVEL
jgi:hypothetical protein